MAGERTGERPVGEQKRAAVRLVRQAFTDAELDGVETECMAQVALFAAFHALVATYGEEPVARFAERLPERLRMGEFTVQPTRQ